MKNPKQKKEFTWAKQGNSYLMTDPETKQMTPIDTISFLVWIQCDGKTSVNDIVDVFSVDENTDIIKASVNGILEKLEKKELITFE